MCALVLGSIKGLFCSMLIRVMSFGLSSGFHVGGNMLVPPALGVSAAAVGRRQSWFTRGASDVGLRSSSNVVAKPLAVCKYVVGKDRLPEFTVCGSKPKKCSGEDFSNSPIEGVYVLMMSNATFYVGKSHNIPERVKQHVSGKGASCVRGRVNRVSPITPRQPDLESWERTETLTRMYKYGICKVGIMY